jgi:hypothetical protein
MNDTDVRDLLARIADEVPATPVDPEPLLRRGYRRMARTAVAGAVGIACAIVVAVGGVGQIRSSGPTTIPADEGQPSRPPTTGNGETTDASNATCFHFRVCFGPLGEGTYTSQLFEPALTFTVPVGWNNPYDTRGSFDLWTPGWSDGWDDPDDLGIYYFDHPGLSLFRDVRPREGCSWSSRRIPGIPQTPPSSDGVYATVGTSAIEVATWVAAHPGIATGAPSPVEVGGLSGYQLDVSIAETWQSCPVDGAPATVPLFDDVRLVEHPKYATMRLIVLDLPDGGNVLIEIDGKQVEAAMPVVRSFEFDPS